MQPYAAPRRISNKSLGSGDEDDPGASRSLFPARLRPVPPAPAPTPVHGTCAQLPRAHDPQLAFVAIYPSRLRIAAALPLGVGSRPRSPQLSFLTCPLALHSSVQCRRPAVHAIAAPTSILYPAWPEAHSEVLFAVWPRCRFLISYERWGCVAAALGAGLRERRCVMEVGRGHIGERAKRQVEPIRQAFRVRRQYINHGKVPSVNSGRHLRRKSRVAYERVRDPQEACAAVPTFVGVVDERSGEGLFVLTSAPAPLTPHDRVQDAARRAERYRVLRSRSRNNRSRATRRSAFEDGSPLPHTRVH